MGRQMEEGTFDGLACLLVTWTYRILHSTDFLTPTCQTCPDMLMQTRFDAFTDLQTDQYDPESRV